MRDADREQRIQVSLVVVAQLSWLPSLLRWRRCCFVASIRIPFFERISYILFFFQSHSVHRNAGILNSLVFEYLMSCGYLIAALKLASGAPSALPLVRRRGYTVS